MDGISRQWYQTLRKPSGTPPSWVFGPVWTVLYAMIAIVLYRMVFIKRNKIPMWVFGLFFVQLALNLAWSPVFFQKRDVRAAFGIIVALLAFLLATIAALFRYDRVGALLLVPYLVWVAYAARLNYGIMTLNNL